MDKNINESLLPDANRRESLKGAQPNKGLDIVDVYQNCLHMAHQVDGITSKVNQNDLFQVLKHGLAFREYNKNTSVDDEVFHENLGQNDEIETTKSAKKLRDFYMDNYVTKFNLHTLYVIDSKISVI